MTGVAIRVDASTAIGSGHVMRCLSLAAELTTAGAEVRFICREHPGNLCDTIANHGGYEVHRLPVTQHTNDDDSGKKLAHAAWLGTGWGDDAAQTAAAIAAHGKKPDWLVVDHYALDARWENALRSSVCNILAIDDLADRTHACDVLLDQNLHLELHARYDGLIPASCQRLLGPRYALLRPEFRAARAQLRNRDGTVQRVLVFFGGVDAGNETAKALRAIAASGVDVAVDIILGPSSPHVENIRALCATLPRTRLHHAPRNIAELMASADLAIGATGATTWERCCLGLPAIVISLAQNQESIAHALADDSLAVYLGASTAVTPDMIAAALLELMRDPSRTAAMSRACAEITDGNGAARVARMFDIVPVVLRPAQAGDCETVHRWRNAEETRRHAHQPDPIPLQQHREWFDATLKNPQRVLLIGERAGQPVGVLRYDCAQACCTVSIYLVPGQHGHGYGSRLLQAGHAWLQQHRRDIGQVRAEVHAANRASADAFLRAGYRRQHNVYLRSLN